VFVSRQFVGYVREHVKTGDPRDRETVVGPMIDAGALERIAGWVESARKSGAKILCGGNVKGPCLDATVIEKPARDLDVCAKEAFGPIITLHSKQDF